MINKFDEKKNYNISSDDFVLVQKDSKISDEKFQTKPTTFARDAFKRFCKNKSSVVGAIILGLLVLIAIFLPAISKANISEASLEERFLAPKFFSSNASWWNGTRKVKRAIYDQDNQKPDSRYVYSAIVEGTLEVDSEPTLVDQTSVYGKGGVLNFQNENSFFSYENKDVNWEDFTKVIYQYRSVTLTSDKALKVNISMSDEENLFGYQLGEYRIYISYQDGDDTPILLLKDWSNEYGDYEIDIQAKIVEAGLTSLEKAKFTIELKPGEMNYSYILFNSMVFTAEEGSANEEFFSKLSFTEGNEIVLRSAPEGEPNNFPDNYWQSTGVKNAHNVSVYYCNFTYDTYEAAYGESEIVVSASELDKYVNNGWLTYTYTKQRRMSDEERQASFHYEILDPENCPILGINSVRFNSKTGGLLEVTGVVLKYQQMGYKKMPKFLFGTDALGFDVFKKAFTGLRTSLILGICTAAFCFAFGLVWGAVSGYFGGNVDLIMERFCDILSGVPWIVVMTLFILHLGNNFFTFFLALCMTGWMGTAGRTRTQFYRFKGREYVLASRTLGSSDTRLIFKHILPNAMGTIITGAVLMIPYVIFSEATLSYLNLGLKGLESFGTLLSDNQKYISIYPNLIVFPSIVMALIMISFNLFGNGLRDAFNPQLKGSE